MSTFQNQFDQYLQAEAADIEKKKADELQAEKDRLAFESQFNLESDRIARPILQEFAAAAVEKGFAAKYDSGKDGRGNYYLRVAFVPVRGVKFSETDKSQESVFSLTCNSEERKVAYRQYYDQRLGAAGMKTAEYGLQSINEEVLRREISQFMDLSLKSRKKF